VIPPLAEVTVRDLNNMEEEVPKNNKTTGEMLFRSPWCTLRYLKIQKGQRSYGMEGWLHIEDVCIWDEDRSIFIVDRTKDVIKSGGEWISTRTLESIISTHLMVKSVAVVGVSHSEWNERPISIVIPTGGHKGKISEEELKEHLIQRVEKGEILKW